MGQYQLEEVKFNMDEVKEYLEEMIQMESADEDEEDVYYDLKWQGRCKKKQYKQVIHNMKQYYHESF